MVVGDVKLSRRAYVMEKVGEFPGRVVRRFSTVFRIFLRIFEGFFGVPRRVPQGGWCDRFLGIFEDFRGVFWDPPTSFLCSPCVALMTS